MGDWQPSPQYLNYLIRLLESATSAKDTAQQREISKSLDDFNCVPEADCYLFIILTEPFTFFNYPVSETVRSMAGLILKNNFRRREGLSPVTLTFFKSFGIDSNGRGALLRALGDPMNLVRSTVGTLLAGIVCKLGRELGSFWPDLLPSLLKVAEGTDFLAGESACEAIAKICEDAGGELTRDPTMPTHLLVSSLITLVKDSPLEKIRLNSLLAINSLIFDDNAVDGHISTFLHVLSSRASIDRSGPMRKAICSSLNLLQHYPAEIKPFLPSILEYMLENLTPSMDHDESVALEACEFWLSWAERDILMQYIMPFLPKLMSALLNNMIYSEDDPDLEANEEGDNVPDRIEDIKPHYHKTSLHIAEDFDGFDDDQNGNNDDEVDNFWTLRKCSASTLDVLSSTLPEDNIIPILLPLISEKLNESNWKFREAGILALGAIAEGCAESVVPHFSSIIPFLLQQQAQQLFAPPLLRAITIWTLSRYATWIECSDFNNSVLIYVLNGMIDSNKKVQNASCTALAVFAEKAKGTVVGNLSNIMQAAAHGLQTFQMKNLIVLYDALGSVADEVGDEFCKNAPSINLIIPLLIQKWTITAANDKSLFALLECMCSLCIVAGSLMHPVAHIIYSRALKMTHDTLSLRSNSENDVGDNDFAIVALDLIGGLVQGLGELMIPIVNSNPIPLVMIILRCLEDESAEIRQSAFALSGGLAQKAPQILIPLVDNNCPIIHFYTSNMNSLQENNSQSSANNAVWSLSEMIVKFPNHFLPHIHLIIEFICKYIQYHDNDVTRGYLENVALCLGRCMALCNLNDDIGQVIPRWCNIIACLGDPVEKTSAWLPMVTQLLNAETLRKAWLVPLLKSVHAFKRPPTELEKLFATLYWKIRNNVIGESNWKKFLVTEAIKLDDFESRFSLQF